MTKSEIRKRLKAIVDDVEKDDDEWFSAWCTKYPEDAKKFEGWVANIKAMKLGKAVAEMQYLSLCLEYDTDTEKEEGYGKQAADM